MNKEEALSDFLQGLRVAINNSLAYSRQHPYFLKNAQDFKEKIEKTLVVLNPIRLTASADTLFLGGKDWSKFPFSAELAQILHQRKIKSIEFRPGLTVDELADFLALLALQPKEIIKKGGLAALLSSVRGRSIVVTDLDYSALLAAGSSGSRLTADNLNQLQEVFKDFNSDDFTEMLFSQLTGESNVDTLNLGLFSRLAGEENASQIASGLVSKIEASPDLKNNPLLLKRITNLLSASDETSVSPAYRKALSALVKNVPATGKLSFDQRGLRNNYHLIMLNLFIQEKSPDALALIAKRLDKEWESVAQDRDYLFLRYLWDTLQQKKSGLPADLAENIARQVVGIVENDIWDEDAPEDLVHLAGSLEKSYSDADFYLHKIFQEKRITACGLELFLKFFPAHLDTFYGLLREARHDLELLNTIIKDLARTELPVSSAVLKEIFAFGNELVKLEVLRAVEEKGDFDPEFLFPLLKEKSIILKKGALAALLKNSAARQKAIAILLGMSSPWGIENQLILENIRIIAELDVREARDYLLSLSKKRFFWNRQLRSKALGVLEAWK